MLAISVFANNEGDKSFPKALLLMAVLAVGGSFLNLLIGPFSILVIFAIMVWALGQFFYLSFKRSLIVTGAYTVAHILVAIYFNILAS